MKVNAATQTYASERERAFLLADPVVDSNGSPWIAACDKIVRAIADAEEALLAHVRMAMPPKDDAAAAAELDAARGRPTETWVDVDATSTGSALPSVIDRTLVDGHVRARLYSVTVRTMQALEAAVSQQLEHVARFLPQKLLGQSRHESPRMPATPSRVADSSTQPARRLSPTWSAGAHATPRSGDLVRSPRESPLRAQSARSAGMSRGAASALTNMTRYRHLIDEPTGTNDGGGARLSRFTSARAQRYAAQYASFGTGL